MSNLIKEIKSEKKLKKLVDYVCRLYKNKQVWLRYSLTNKHKKKIYFSPVLFDKINKKTEITEVFLNVTILKEIEPSLRRDMIKKLIKAYRESKLCYSKSKKHNKTLIIKKKFSSAYLLSQDAELNK